MKSVKSLITAFVLSISFYLLLPATLMGQAKTTVVADTLSGQVVKFVGVEDDMLLFDVMADNLPAGPSTISILDHQGILLFEERIYASKVSRRFKFNRDHVFEMITFKIVNKTILLDQSFTISHKFEEKWEVKRAK
jgi:hypothetical protein